MQVVSFFVRHLLFQFWRGGKLDPLPQHVSWVEGIASHLVDPRRLGHIGLVTT